MEKTSLERAPFARARGARSGSAVGGRALRRAALLVGTGLFLHSAPAWASDECGPVPPDGKVTCPAGEYPNGITYFYPFGPTEFRLEPGFRARGGSRIEGSNVRLIGPVDTSF